MGSSTSNTLAHDCTLLLNRLLLRLGGCLKGNIITAWNEFSLTRNVMLYNRKLLMRGFVVEGPHACKKCGLVRRLKTNAVRSEA